MKNIFLIIICALLLQLSAFAQFEKWRPTVHDPHYYYQLDNNDSTLATMFVYAGSLPNEVSTDSIVSGGTTTNIIDTKNKKIGAIIFPATFTGATITILTSDDTTSANFKTLQFEGDDFTVTASDGKQCAISPINIISLLRYVKYVSASAEATSRTIKTVLITF